MEGGPFHAVRAHFGITTFGISAIVAKSAGDRLMNEHAETQPDASEEIYLVLAGRARFEIDGETVDAPTGTFVYVPAGLKRTAFAEEDGTTTVAIGGAAPGKPYVVNGWDLFVPLFPLFETGEFEKGAAEANKLLADHPHAALYYNTACFESRAGQTDAALAHLRQAVEMQADLAELASNDDDFEALRELPAYQEIVAST
jgi:hypothetical protein